MAETEHFFSIAHDFHVSAAPLAESAELPSPDQLQSRIPLPFKLAAEISHLDASALRPLRNLGESAHDLVDFLNIQSKKIDMIMTYIMILQDEQQQRLPGQSFGGSKVCYLSPEPLAPGRLVELKIFITDENCAVYCIGQISDCQPHEAADAAFAYRVTADYARIRDEDQEQLVRASLRVQSRKLKERAESRGDK